MKKRAEVSFDPAVLLLEKNTVWRLRCQRGFLSRRVFGCLRHRNLEENDANKTKSGKLVLLLLYLCF